MQRIQSITLRNFKFFYGTEEEQKQNKIELNQNNLLLYGENGSGKSSIYWALYTFLQSCKKKDIDIIKYFDATHPQNLRNRFANDTDSSAIILEIVSATGTITKEISNLKLETNQTTDTTVDKIIAGSDFINYKYLSKLYDFRNSEEIDLFEWFEREVLMFIDFEESYTDHNGNLSTSTLASDWWKFICEAPKTLPKNKTNINTPNQGSVQYKRYTEETIPKFTAYLKRFLTSITLKANKYLAEEFKEVFEVDFDVSQITCEFNKKLSTRARDGKVHFPKIPLKIKFNHSELPDVKKGIGKPHTFLNEARLTAIALAIRLAMLDERLYDENSASLLVLDDLLLSLDMNHRDKVLDIVLKKVDEYQILILTHDRAFYNLCKRRIENRTKESDPFKWEFKEMYQSTIKDSDIPCPFIPEKKNYLDLAKKYLYEFDYPACANYLRKESERVLKSLLPLNKTIYIKDDEGSKPLQLDNLIANFRELFIQIGGDFKPFEKLKEHKDLLMNPLSHDNISTPIYKQELMNSIAIIEKLNLLDIKIFETDSDNSKPLILKETDYNTQDWEYTFFLKENLRIIKDLNGKWLFTNPKCLFDRKNKPSEKISCILNYNGKLNRMYSGIRFNLGIKTDDNDNIKNFKDILYIEETKLEDILNS